MLGKRSILAKLAGQRIRLMRHNSPLIRATPFGPPMRIHLAQRMNPIPKKVILRSRLHHSLHVKQVKIQSQMNERVHIIDFHISSNNHPSQTLGHKKSSNQNQFSQLRARQDGTHAPIATDPACCRKRSSSVSNNVNLGAPFAFCTNPLDVQSGGFVAFHVVVQRHYALFVAHARLVDERLQQSRVV